MPTKKKRVSFIPREDVLKIIDKLSLENNLSNSKIISNLVEEALSIRGIFNKKNGKATQLYREYQERNDSLKDLSEDTADFKDNENIIVNTNLGNDKNPSKSSLFKQTDQKAFDAQTYKNFLSFLKFQEMMDKYNN